MGEEKLYDLAFLNKVSGGDESFILEMITTFKEIAPAYLKKAYQLLEENSIDSLSKETHKIIPGVSFLGAKKLESNLMLIEEYTKKNIELEKVLDLLNNCKQMISDLLDTFEKDFG